MTAAVPAGCAANIASFPRATFAIAWWRSPATNSCSGICFNIAFLPGAGSPATVSEIFSSRRWRNVTGDFPRAVQLSAQVLAIRGRIFPSTAQNVTLEAELEDGKIVSGETNISRSRKRIARVRLVPRRVRPLPDALAAIRQADLILIGPGSLYTSILPNLLVEQVVEVIANSPATRVYIANVMTQPGETQHYSVADHVRAIYAHTRRNLFDFVVINRAQVSPRLLRRYAAQGAEPVDPSFSELDRMHLRYVTGDILQQEGVARHDQARLTRLLLDKFVEHKAIR